LPERLHELGAVHARQEFGARLPVAMLSGYRAAVLDHQVGRFFHEAAHRSQACARVQIEGDAAMDAAIAEVAVERRAVAVPVEQRAELAQVIANAGRIDRRILPSGARLFAHPGDRVARPGADFTDGPY